MKSEVFLLDSNVLIALTTPAHSLNARASAWFRRGFRFATCPITQGALFRFHLRLGAGANMVSARSLLAAISSLPRHEFWADSLSFFDMPVHAGITGHRQVTDAYLASLAVRHGGRLVTMDRGIAAIHPAVAFVE